MEQPNAEIFTGRGFDTCQAPPESTMRAWRSSPYRAVGVYIGGRGRACPRQPHLTPDWVRSATRLGWRLLPLYVGSQAPCVIAENKRHVPINRTQPRRQGEQEGRDAVRSARGLGMARGSAVYLDMESYRYPDGWCAEVTLAFIQGWSGEVRRQGYLPGFYSSADTGIRHLEQARRDGRPELPDAVWFARWSVPPSVDDEPRLAPGAWQPHRRIHQYAGDVYESWGGHGLRIDRNQVDAPVAIIR